MNMDDYTKDQLKEIEKGKQAGVDVSIYEDPGFLAIQMRQIRIGLEKHLAVQWYAKKEYDWFQMEEIRKGLQKGIEVAKYADPDIPFEVMRQIRKGLKKGIDLSGGKMLSAGILRQFRKAAEDHVDIWKYIKEGYEEEQLRQIRIALKRGLDMEPYISKTFRGVSMKEIRQGLEKGVDVSIYAREDLNWQQMREIRIGLEERLDVTPYVNVFYSWQQMREIRLGLEERLPVSKYSSLMYTARTMNQMRQKLLNQRVSRIETGRSHMDEVACNGFTLLISRDQMEAAIATDGKEKQITYEEVQKELEEYGICYGLDETIQQRFPLINTKPENLVAARGRRPVDGEDGWYEYFIDRDVKKTPIVLEDGSVDYQNAKWFEIVKKGQKLASYHFAKEGSPGYTVFGEELPGQRGKEKRILSGAGFSLLEDGKTYVADYDGKIEFVGDQMQITNILVLDDVIQSKGNVDFNGSVYIRGMVGAGMIVRATEDIIVDGFTESAVLEAGGDILLRKGNNAGGKGHIHAQGDVCGTFFESSKITAGREIRANYCLNSDLKAGESITISGKNGVLMGGMAKAENAIQAYYIGSDKGLITNLKLGSSPQYSKEEASLANREKKVQHELLLLRNAYKEIRSKYPPEVRNQNPIYLKLEDAIYTKEKELEKIINEREAFKKQRNRRRAAKVVVQGRLFTGVCVEINGVIWHSEQVDNITLKNDANTNTIRIYRNGN